MMRLRKPKPEPLRSGAYETMVAMLPVPEPVTVRAFTPAARLLDEGWEPPVDGLREVIRQREALRAAIVDMKALRSGGPGVTDESPIQVAVRYADREGIVRAATSVGIGLWLDRAGAEGGAVLMASWALENRLFELLYHHSRRIVDSLGDRDSEAAAWMRGTATNLQAYPSPPEPRRSDYEIR
jgi:hypothetical protein